MENNPSHMEYNPSHRCAQLLLSSRNHNLRHVSYDKYSWKYKMRIWEELRPLNIRKIDYGGTDPSFLIKRKGICRTELRELCDWFSDNINHK